MIYLNSIIAASTTLGGTTNYGYDSKNQLTGESSTRAGNVTNTFNYDSVGNPTTWQLNVAGQTNQNTVRTFNANNQETTLNSGGQVQFVYDGNGNPTNYKGIATTYDVANHLTSFGTQLTAGYRSDGKRAWKQNSAGVRTYFLYDGDALLCELDGNGNVTYTNTWGANGLVSRRDHAASSTRFYTWDNQGSVAQRLDANGAVLDSFTITAFGQRTGSGGDPYSGYNGQWGYYTDYETGLILCTHRYYDPNSGRWLTRDPIGYSGGLNLYAYIGNQPINGVDPMGLKVTDPYWQQVGDVFRGYGDVLNPVNGYRGAVGLYNLGRNKGGGAALSALGNGVLSTLTRWTQTSDAREFGQSFGGTLLILSPLIKRIPLNIAVRTPYGLAFQELSLAAFRARWTVCRGATMYRMGTLGKSAAAEGQFWSLEHPAATGFAGRYGIPPANVAAADFIESATVPRGRPFITRSAPGVGSNPGGGIEAVTPENGVTLKNFSTF